LLHPARAAFGAALLIAVTANVVAPARAEAPSVIDVWTWGRNNEGQLGGVPANQAVPNPMHVSGSWTAIAAGGEHTLGVDGQGNVWAWGFNSNGELGDGSTTPKLLPVEVSGVSGATLVSAGATHSLAYRAADSTLWGWGSNAAGQLAQPTNVASALRPTVLPPLGALRAISAGSLHSLVLGADGTVYAWGGNPHGQLGTGDLVDRTTPTQVLLPVAASAISAGGGHSLAVAAADGQVWAWGANQFGQLGQGMKIGPDGGVSTPIAVPGVTSVVDVSAGDLHALALTADGHVWAWGYNTEGQVGDGEYTVANTGVLSPVMLDIDDVVAVRAGGIHSVVLRANGEVWTWGNDSGGACGDNARTDAHLPVQALGISGVTAIAAGENFSVAIAPRRPSTSVVIAGDEDVDTSVPVTRPALDDIAAPPDVMQTVAGWHHTLLLDGKHRVWAFGDNSVGQLGIPGPSRASPHVVDVPAGGVAGVVQIAARANQSFALRADGVVFAWGDNGVGQLGIGAPKSAAVPTELPGLVGIVGIAAGELHGLAFDVNGVLWGWGDDSYGQLGIDRTTTPFRTPVQTRVATSPLALAAGAFHSVILGFDGRLTAWGAGFRGQLGSGNSSNQTTATPVLLPVLTTTLAAGAFHTVVVAEHGDVWSFGDSSACQLGSYAPALTGVGEAVKVPGAPPSVQVAAGEYHSVALATDGSAWAWGDDSRGQLGRAGTSLPHFACEPAPIHGVDAVTVGAGLDHTVMVGP